MIKLSAYVKLLLNESPNDYSRVNDDFSDRRTSQLIDIVDSFIKNKGEGIVHWQTIPAKLLAGVWLQFGKLKRIDINKLDKISDRMLTNIARLRVCTELSGHTSNDPADDLEEMGYNFTEKDLKDLAWYVGDFISDYGLNPLEELYVKIYNADTPEEKLYAIDKALNVIHRRNDLAAMFVEGGTKTLTKIYLQGGYSSDP